MKSTGCDTTRRRSCPGSLEPEPDTFLDASIEGYYAVLLYKVHYRGREALLYVLLEHKSSPNRFTLLQLLRYMSRIWEKHLAQTPKPATLPPIIPVILYHSDKGRSPPTSFHSLFDQNLMSDPELARMTPRSESRLDDIGHLSDEALRARALDPQATLGMVFHRDGRRRGRLIKELAKWADLFRTLLATP